MRNSLLALPISLIALTSAALENHHLIRDALHNQQPYVHHRDISRDDVSNPCGLLSEVYDEAFLFPGLPVIVDVRPSVAVSCLRSVPVDRERDLRLIEYLRPYVSFQSTIETLADPPEEYLLHGVDIWRGLDEIEARLKGFGYSSQYEVMLDLQSIFVAANDNHFDYPPALLNVFLYVRTYLDFVSISSDGVSPPEIYHRRDLDLLGEDAPPASYEPSPVDTVDDIPIAEWLEQNASRRPSNFRDPDAQYNSEFTSVPSAALMRMGMSQVSPFEVPDNYTVMFRNESGFIVQSMLMFAPGVNFSGIDSGETFHERFEVVPEGTEEVGSFRLLDIAQTPTFPGLEDILDELIGEGKEEEEPHIPGYPMPVALHSQSSISGYLLDDPEHQDTAVLAILDFYPVFGSMLAGASFDITKYILEARAVVAEFVRAAQEDGRTKLIIDMSANGGGAILLAHEIYRLLFPEGDINIYDRYRTNEAFEAAAVAADFDVFLGELITSFKPQSPDGEIIDQASEFMGPFTAGGQTVTAPFRRDLSMPWTENTWVNGFEPDASMTTIKTAPFDPKNITIITDGVCASACASFVDLLTRNHGIRTVAFGGRPDKLPMQAIGGVRGTLLRTYPDLLAQFWSLTNEVFSSHSPSPSSLSALSDAVRWTPSFHKPPLMPLANSNGDAALVGLGVGRVNARNGYTVDDLDGLPLHFKYDAAHCRLFYTLQMVTDITETWRRAAGVTWRGEKCVEGSTVESNHTMGEETVKFGPEVRTRAKPGTGPGALPPRW